METLMNYLKKTGAIKVILLKEFEQSTEKRDDFLIVDKCISEIDSSVKEIKKESYNSVIWQSNKVSISKTTFKGIAEDSISYQFGGCLMARLRSKSDRTYRIAHIHCEKSVTKYVSSFCDYVSSSCEKESTSFDELIIFKPLPASYFKEVFDTVETDIRFEVWGIIDNAGKCFSVLVYKLNSYNECRVLCIVEHINNHSMAFDEIKNVKYMDLLEYMNNKLEYLTFKPNSMNIKSVEEKVGHHI